MAVVKIWRCRDHHNGGRFDGACHLDCNGGLNAGMLDTPVRVRFRFDASTTRNAVWGTGDATHTDGYVLIIEQDGDDYHPVVRFLDTETVFDTIALSPDTLYDVSVWINDGAAHITVHDRYNRLLWSDNQSISATGSLTTNNLYAGATCNDLGDPELLFRGVVFDLMYAVSASDKVRLVFYEGYSGASSSVVKDARNVRDATVISPPADFWSPRTDISSMVVQAGRLRRECDSWGAPCFSDVTLTCIGGVAANPHDIIEIEAAQSNAVNWIYRIERVEETPDGLLKLYCVDALSDLQHIPTDRFFTITGTFSLNRTDWWSNYHPTLLSGVNYSEVEYHYDAGNTARRWVTLAYILQSAVAFLQLDNLLTADLSGLLDTASKLTHNSAIIDYRWFAFNLYELMAAGRSASEDNASIAVSQLLRQLAIQLRFTWYIGDSKLCCRPMALAARSLSDDSKLNATELPAIEHGPHQIRQKRLQSGVDPASAWGGSDTEEVSYHNLGGAYRAYNQVEDLSVTAILRVQRHTTSGMALQSLTPDHLAQLADILDDCYSAPRRIVTARTPFIDNHDRNDMSKIDNIEAQTSEVKQLY